MTTLEKGLLVLFIVSVVQTAVNQISGNPIWQVLLIINVLCGMAFVAIRGKKEN